MAGGIITTGSHPQLLWPGIHAVWGQVYNEHVKEYTNLYDVEDTDRAYEMDQQVTGFGLAMVKAEGQPASYDAELQGYFTRYIPIAYSLGYIVTYEELKDNLYEEVSMRRAKALAFSMTQTIENAGAAIYNNGFNANYFTTGDGAPLFSANHTTTSGGTFSNVLNPPADLTEASLEDMCIQIMGAQGDRGLLINIMPEMLIVPRQEWFNGNRILKSVLQSGTGNNDINVLHATNAFPKGVQMNHYLTAPHAWFVRTNIPNGMKMFWRERPNFAQDNDFDTKNAKALSYMRLAFGATDPRGIFASNGP